NNNRLDFHYMYFKFPMPTNIVIVYDGANSAYVPVEMEIQSNGSRSQRVNTAYYAGTNDQSGSNPNSFVLDDYWYGTSLDYANWCGEKNSSSYDEKVGYLSDVLSESGKQRQGNTSHFMHNRLKFIDNFNADEYYKAYNKFSFAVSGKNNSTSYTTAKAQNNSNNVYVLNYAPVYNALKSSNPTAMPNGKDNLGIKDFYTAYVKNNEDNWTESSLKQFYYAAYLLLTSNPNDYKSSFSSGVDTNVKSAANEIKNAMNAFNSINLEKRADFTALDSKFAQGESVIANLNQTNLYGESLVSALITALNDSKANAATTADERKDISENIAQSEINTQVNNLVSAINAINNASVCEVSALNEVIDRLNNLDDDIYDYSGEDVQAIIEALTDGIDGSDCAYTSSDSVNYTVKTVKEGVSQTSVDSAVSVGLSSLADNVRMYDVEFSGDASLNFAYEGSEERITDNHYKSTYNNTAVFSTDNADTAWFMEYNSETTSRDKQYQGSGETYSTKVIGNMNVFVEQRCAATPNRVSIQRDYQNGKYPVQQINYVASGTDYQLPEATKILGYEFEGYYIGGERITASSVTVNSDIEITARYSASTSSTFSVVVKSTQGEILHSSDDSYNTKVAVSDSNAYGWVEKISGENSYRPFCIGSDLNFYVTEATEIKAVESAAEFSAAGTLPAINIKQSDANVEIVSGRNKVFFNGQIVNDPSGEATILEYGFLIGTTINSTPTESELVLENAGAHEDYRIIRAKSTKLVGANQFTIAVSGLSGAISYRGYVTYQIGGADGEIKTVYTSVANQVI
ncbi:MAG: hypothetical protein IKN26_06025, partial [Eubacterium sp.]|nr:hypothetical protein [Eubacterium sp.]